MRLAEGLEPPAYEEAPAPSPAFSISRFITLPSPRLGRQWQVDRVGLGLSARNTSVAIPANLTQTFQLYLNQVPVSDPITIEWIAVDSLYPVYAELSAQHSGVSISPYNAIECHAGDQVSLKVQVDIPEASNIQYFYWRVRPVVMGQNESETGR